MGLVLWRVLNMKHCSAVCLFILVVIKLVHSAPITKSSEVKSNDLKLKVEYEFDLGDQGYKVMLVSSRLSLNKIY